MAEATFYYDNHITGEWTDPDNMIDGILTNYAYTSADGAYERLTGTTCDGTDLGTITKVELRCYGHGDGDDRIDLAFNLDRDPEYQITMPASEGWSGYVDVTTDPNVAGWTWAKVAAFDYTRPEFDKVAKGNTMHCAKVEIRVTYTPYVAPTVTTQAVTDIDINTATGNGTITDKGGEDCTKRGVCWNTTGNPTVADSKSEEKDSFGTGPFTRPMTGLTPEQHYYVKAYAYNSAGYGYGNQVEFDTYPENCNILRPNTPGDEENISEAYIGGGKTDDPHYTLVNEETHDGDYTVLQNRKVEYERDLYHITSPSGSGTIDKIKVHAVCNGAGTPSQPSMKIAIKTGGIAYEGSAHQMETENYINYTEEWINNPGGGVWTWAQIESLQIGAAIRRTDPDETWQTRFTQIYVEVFYTPVGVAEWKKVAFTSEPPTPNAWNQLKREAGTGWKKILYEGE